MAQWNWLMILTVLVVGGLVFAFGCGGESQPEVDEGPFRKAITAFCKDRSYDMKVDSFKSITVDGDNATAVCEMKQKDDMYNMKVTWELKLE